MITSSVIKDAQCNHVLPSQVQILQASLEIFNYLVSFSSVLGFKSRTYLMCYSLCKTKFRSKLNKSFQT